MTTQTNHLKLPQVVLDAKEKLQNRIDLKNENFDRELTLLSNLIISLENSAKQMKAFHEKYSNMDKDKKRLEATKLYDDSINISLDEAQLAIIKYKGHCVLKENNPYFKYSD